jgi:hypothetical protein
MQTFDWFQISGEFFNRIGRLLPATSLASAAAVQRIAGIQEPVARDSSCASELNGRQE